LRLSPSLNTATVGNIGRSCAGLELKEEELQANAADFR
jgi:hypothetical protein